MSDGKNHGSTFTSNEEYFKALQIWLDNYNRWYEFNKTFMCLSTYHHFMTANFNEYASLQSQSASQDDSGRRRAPRVEVRRENEYQQILERVQQIRQRHSFKCMIPPIWKRIAAETIDFIILFFIKFYFTDLLVNKFNILTIKQYDFETIQKSLNADINDAIDMTVDIFMFEIIHRTIVCTFETYFLAGRLDGHGGATPGKLFMNLRVVHATQIHLYRQPHVVNSRIVLVYPGANLGYVVAFVRSFIKNLIILLLFPMCFIGYFFNFNRTGYDFICNSVVVELLPENV